MQEFASDPQSPPMRSSHDLGRLVDDWLVKSKHPCTWGVVRSRKKQLGSKVRTWKRLSVDKQTLNRKEGRKEILENTYCEGRTKRERVCGGSKHLTKSGREHCEKKGSKKLEKQSWNHEISGVDVTCGTSNGIGGSCNWQHEREIRCKSCRDHEQERMQIEWQGHICKQRKEECCSRCICSELCDDVYDHCNHKWE